MPLWLLAALLARAGALGVPARAGALGVSTRCLRASPAFRRVPVAAVAALDAAPAAADAGTQPGGSEAERELEWEALGTMERFSRLSDIRDSIRARRTVEEAEFALTLEADFNSDPTILRDIDFGAILARLRADLADGGERLRAAGVLTLDEQAALRARQVEAQAKLSEVAPQYTRRGNQSVGAVAQSVPKLRRVISKARELPLAVEMQRPNGSAADPHADGGFDLQAVLRESKNLASATREVWDRLNGGNNTKEEELMALQRESKALLSLRAEATKLRAGFRLVERQKELKRKSLIRYNAEAVLDEMLRADRSIMRLQKELSLKAALLEMERIYLAMEAELSSSSTLTDQLLPMVERYGSLEFSIRDLVGLVRSDRHAAVDDAELDRIEREISDMILRLGLQAQDPETFSWRGAYEAASVTLKKALQGITFYLRGLQLMGQDVQLFVSMITRAVLQGYTLRQREVNILRRIAKDLVTIVPVVIILLIPLSPIGHVLVFSFIQRFFPDFFPSQFTEERQNIMSMYTSLTAPTAGVDVLAEMQMAGAKMDGAGAPAETGEAGPLMASPVGSSTAGAEVQDSVATAGAVAAVSDGASKADGVRGKGRVAAKREDE